MARTAEQSSTFPDHFVGFIRPGEPRDIVNYFPDTNSITASVEMTVLCPDGQFEEIGLPVVARLEKEWSGKFLYYKPTPDPKNITVFGSVAKREYPDANHPGPLYVIGLTPLMYRRPNHYWGDMQEAWIIAERIANTRNGAKIMVFPVRHVDFKTHQQALKDLAVNTVHPASFPSGLHRRVFSGYSSHTRQPHDLHL